MYHQCLGETQPTLKDQLVSQIEKAIMSRHLLPGDRLREQDLTTQFEVSRTPVREALIVLESMGLIISYPNRGYFVRELTAEDIREIFEMRAGLETQACALIIKRGGLSAQMKQHLAYLITQQQKALLKLEQQASGPIDETDSELTAMNYQFHQTLVKLANNRRLLEKWTITMAQVGAALSYHVRTATPDQPYLSIADHQAILQSLLSGDIQQVWQTHHRINHYVAQLCLDGL